MKVVFIAAIVLIGSKLCLLAADPIPASSVKWEGPFGSSEATPKSTLCLMARGFFRMATSAEMPALIAAWLRDHPKAMVVPVASFGPVMDRDPESKMTFVWIVDGEQNLNLELVHQGCFEPQTQTIGEGQKLEAPAADYEAFVQKALEAGKQAKEKKLGVWKASAE
jgi:hypothetical protein